MEENPVDLYKDYESKCSSQTPFLCFIMFIRILCFQLDPHNIHNLDFIGSQSKLDLCSHFHRYYLIKKEFPVPVMSKIVSVQIPFALSFKLTCLQLIKILKLILRLKKPNKNQYNYRIFSELFAVFMCLYFFYKVWLICLPIDQFFS